MIAKKKVTKIVRCGLIGQPWKIHWKIPSTGPRNPLKLRTQLRHNSLEEAETAPCARPWPMAIKVATGNPIFLGESAVSGGNSLEVSEVIGLPPKSDYFSQSHVDLGYPYGNIHSSLEKTSIFFNVGFSSKRCLETSFEDHH